MAAPLVGALLLLLLLFAAARAADMPMPVNEEMLGLVVFQSALSDLTGVLSARAESDATPYAWPHVERDQATSRVLRLALDGLALSSAGHGVPRGLDRLPALQLLSLASNNLSGALAPGLSLLGSLRSLNLSYNGFSGPLPDNVVLLGTPRCLTTDLNMEVYG